MKNKPFHVTTAGECKSKTYKTTRDRFGRPLTIRYQYNKMTYIANREQVCNIQGHDFSSNRSFIADQLDDIIWKNLSIWAREREHLWEDKAKKAAYLVCHELFASYHCSSMFPNCTAEYTDQKPAPVCRELCEKLVDYCSWGTAYEGEAYLPYEPVCTQYPSRDDPYKKCTEMGVRPEYLYRIASAPVGKAPNSLSILTTALMVLFTVYVYGGGS